MAYAIHGKASWIPDLHPISDKLAEPGMVRPSSARRIRSNSQSLFAFTNQYIQHVNVYFKSPYYMLRTDPIK